MKEKLLHDRDNHWLDKAIIEGGEKEDDDEKYRANRMGWRIEI